MLCEGYNGMFRGIIDTYFAWLYSCETPTTLFPEVFNHFPALHHSPSSIFLSIPNEHFYSEVNRGLFACKPNCQKGFLPKYRPDFLSKSQVQPDNDYKICSKEVEHLIQPIYLQVLRKIHNGLAGSSAVWVVTGSLGMALQGMPVTVNDIDIQTDRSGAYEIERRFAPFVTRKVTFSEAETIRSHFGSLTIDGIRVEIMGDIQKRLEDGSWEEPVDPAPFRRYVERNGMRIPVLSLEYEYRAYLRLGRREKAEKIRRWLEGQNS